MNTKMTTSRNQREGGYGGHWSGRHHRTGNSLDRMSLRQWKGAASYWSQITRADVEAGMVEFMRRFALDANISRQTLVNRQKQA